MFARPPLSNAAEQRCSVASCSNESARDFRLGLKAQLPQPTSWPALRPQQRSAVLCSAQKRDPPDAPKEETQRRGGREWLQTLLSRFGPLTDKAPNRLILDFEKPLVELDNRIKEVGFLPQVLSAADMHCCGGFCSRSTAARVPGSKMSFRLDLPTPMGSHDVSPFQRAHSTINSDPLNTISLIMQHRPITGFLACRATCDPA